MGDATAPPAVDPAPLVGPRAPSPHGWSPVLRRGYWTAAALLAGVVVACGVAAAVSGAVPTSDDALLAVRARDVFSAHPPLLSIGSSGGISAGTAYNQPGAVALWFLAPFVALLGGVGVSVGTAVLNALCLLGVAWLAARTARPALAAGVLAAAAGLAWGMGSAVLVSPWNSNQATLPFALLVIGAWAVWSGRPAGGPLGMAGGAVAAQTHLSFVPPSVAVVAVLLVGMVVAVRRSDGEDRRRWIRAAVGTVGVGLVLGAPVLLEQALHGTDGNLSRLVGGATFDVATLSVPDAAAVLAAVLVRPPFFSAGSWATPVYLPDLPGRGATAIGLALLAGACAAAVGAAHRRSDRAVVAAVAVPAVALVAGALASQTFPYRVGVPVPYFRWAWPAAALLAAALVVPVLEAAARRGGAAARSALAPVLLVVAVVAAAGAGLTRVEEFTGGTVWAEPLVDELVRPVARRLADRGPVEFVQSSQEAALALSPSILLELPSAGVDVRAADPYLVQQVGDHYRATGREPWVLVSRTPDDPRRVGERLAATAPRTPGERAEARRLRRDGAAVLQAHPLRLTASGRAVGDPAVADLVAGVAVDPAAVASNRFLSAALRAGLVEADGAGADETRRLAAGAERLTELDGRSISYWLLSRAEYDVAGG